MGVKSDSRDAKLMHGSMDKQQSKVFIWPIIWHSLTATNWVIVQPNKCEIVTLTEVWLDTGRHNNFAK